MTRAPGYTVSPTTTRPAPVPSVVFDTYWRFAAERQAIYRRRLAGSAGPWTDDPILRTFRFTNAYRAADRTSQFLLRRVIYEGSPVHREQVFRILLFRLFNLRSTWEELAQRVGPIETATFEPSLYAKVLGDHAARGNTLYSAAYVIPPVPQTGRQRKHEQHLELVKWMLDDRVDDRLASAASLQDVFNILTRYPSLGRFLAFQLAIDINYGPHLQFSEMDFVVAGPGASEGIRKCFLDREGWSDEEIIRWVTDRQKSEFARRGLRFDDLWGRHLQLIDIQNLFCEIAKYSRVSHPEFTSRGGRHRIKRTFTPGSEIERPWFPPKWSINERVWSPTDDWSPAKPLVQQLHLALEQV